ncbi:hypothetical protein BDR05DRAFT_1062257 [Suillus weaverae]|nr:hypothetical protein BDR05DRAFT_1062257 [Suillus weaverae]
MRGGSSRHRPHTAAVNKEKAEDLPASKYAATTSTEKFTPPSQLFQAQVVVPLKMRLVALVVLLRSSLAQAQGDSSMDVFAHSKHLDLPSSRLPSHTNSSRHSTRIIPSSKSKKPAPAFSIISFIEYDLPTEGRATEYIHRQSGIGDLNRSNPCVYHEV